MAAYINGQYPFPRSVNGHRHLALPGFPIPDPDGAVRRDADHVLSQKADVGNEFLENITSSAAC